MRLHRPDHRGRRHRTRVRETLQQRREAEEVVAMRMGDVNRREALATGDDPVQQGLRLGGGEEGVHQDSVALALDQHRGVRHPRQVLLAGRQVAAEARALDRQGIPAQRWSDGHD